MVDDTATVDPVDPDAPEARWAQVDPDDSVPTDDTAEPDDAGADL